MAGTETDPSNNENTRRRTLLRSVVAGAAFGLAGCVAGLQDDSGGGGTFVVGATVPETGPVSSLGKELRQGYELGVKHINDDGGIDGSELELRIEDDKSEPERVGQKLREMVRDEGVDMLWGSITTPRVLAGSAVAEREQVPFLGVGFAYQAPHESKGFEWTYVPYPKSSHIAEGNVRLLDGIEGDSPSNVGIWETNSGWGEELGDEWESRFADAGYEVVVRERISRGTRDFSTLISSARDANVEVLLSNPIPPDGITAMKQMESNGWTPKLVEMVRAAHSNGWWKALGQTGAYTVTSPGWVPGLEGGGNARFQSGYESEYGSSEMTIPVTVGGAYNLTQTARQAVEAAASHDPGDVQSALRSETFRTVIGEFGFGDNGVISGGSLKTPTGQWWQGEQRLIYPNVDTDVAMDLRYPMADWDER